MTDFSFPERKNPIFFFLRNRLPKMVEFERKIGSNLSDSRPFLLAKSALSHARSFSYSWRVYKPFENLFRLLINLLYLIAWST